MMDAQTFVETIFSWGLYAGAAMAIGLFILATIYRAMGNENYKRAYLASLIALILAVSGWDAVKQLVGTVDTSLFPEEWMIYAIAGVSFVASVIYFSLGKIEEGKWQLFATVLCIVSISLFSTLADMAGSGSDMWSGQGYIVYITTKDSYIKPGDTATFKVIADSPKPPYEFVIDYGDGVVEQYSSSSNSIEVTHTYESEGSYAVVATVTDGDGITGVGYAGVGVSPGYSLPFPFGAIVDFVQNTLFSSLGGMINTPIQMLYYAPYFRISDDNMYYQWYKSVTTIAMGVLGVYLLLRFAYSAMHGEDPGKEIVVALKDAIVVVILMVLAPYIYNISAGVLNSITSISASQIDLGWVYGGLAGLATLGMVIGYFTPGFADLAAFAVVACLITLIMGMLRYWIIYSMIVASPILLVSYLHPAFKRVVGHYLTLLSGLLLAGPITAIGLAMITNSLKNSDIAGLVAYMLSAPIVSGLFPWLIGIMISGNIVGGAPMLAGLGARAVGRAAMLSGSSAAVGVAAGATASVAGRAGAGTVRVTNGSVGGAGGVGTTTTTVTSNVLSRAQIQSVGSAPLPPSSAFPRGSSAIVSRGAGGLPDVGYAPSTRATLAVREQ
ncbi:PKD domain-containing protein, partial [Archaeoglobus neptunius]|uniref:PKD domain-containing protein n=1 Tax=Archaeoglobus neptunius TaxID=2798580 RepID=UPI001928925C